MSGCLGSCLFGMSFDAGALGGMLGMASGFFILLAATTFASALLYTIRFRLCHTDGCQTASNRDP